MIGYNDEVLRGKRYPFIDPLLPQEISSSKLSITQVSFINPIASRSQALSAGMCIFAGLYTMNHLAINCTMKVLVLLLLIAQFNITQVELVPIEVSSSGELKPVGPTEYRVLVEANANYARRRLAPFQLCLLCKCCTASSTNCATMPCCFGIDCQLPNKPFGVCAFVPKTCNCTSCAA